MIEVPKFDDASVASLARYVDENGYDISAFMDATRTARALGGEKYAKHTRRILAGYVRVMFPFWIVSLSPDCVIERLRTLFTTSNIPTESLQSMFRQFMARPGLDGQSFSLYTYAMGVNPFVLPAMAETLYSCRYFNASSYRQYFSDVIDNLPPLHRLRLLYQYIDVQQYSRTLYIYSPELDYLALTPEERCVAEALPFSNFFQSQRFRKFCQHSREYPVQSMKPASLSFPTLGDILSADTVGFAEIQLKLTAVIPQSFL